MYQNRNKPEPYRIQKGIPICDAWRQPRGKPKTHVSYPFKDMDVGDSFSFNHWDSNLVRTAASAHTRRHGHKFIVRRVSPVYGRCWRIV